MRVARNRGSHRGTILAIDRGDIVYEWFARLTQDGVYLVTRLKDNADYEVVEEWRFLRRGTPAGSGDLLL